MSTYESEPSDTTTPDRDVVVMVGRGPNSSSCPTACTVVPMHASSTTSRRVRRRAPGEAKGSPEAAGPRADLCTHKHARRRGRQSTRISHRGTRGHSCRTAAGSAGFVARPPYISIARGGTPHTTHVMRMMERLMDATGSPKLSHRRGVMLGPCHMMTCGSPPHQSHTEGGCDHGPTGSQAAPKETNIDRPCRPLMP